MYLREQSAIKKKMILRYRRKTMMGIKINLDVIMAQRKIGLMELAQKVDITPANLSILKNNKAKALRFSTLEAICRELKCQPGDMIEYEPEEE